MRIYCFVILFLTIMTFKIEVQAQVNGCTDPQANNYNASATVNDGSCSYTAVNLPLTDKTLLSSPLLDETSGVEFVNGKLWTFNDSGNSNSIYRVDTSSSTVFQTVQITNATNVDWEEMTSNDDYLFVGDFGNNAGNRQNLKIYRIAISSLTPAVTAVTSDIINFSYSDQTSFPTQQNNNNFDCESMIFFNDSIHLFSKNWVDKQTRHYVLPNTPGTHVAQYRETLNVGYLVTSASIQKFGVITLIGYDNSATRPISLYMLYDYKNGLFFNGNKRKFNLSTELVNGQVEGVDFFNTSYAYISNEKYTNGATLVPKLRTFSLLPFLPAAFVYPKPDAEFTANNDSICQNGFIGFTDQSLNTATSWQWVFPGGTPATSVLQHPQVQYNTPGVYAATLIAGNAAGYDTIVKSNFITVKVLPSASITSNGITSFCSGNSVALNANSAAGLTYQWKRNAVDISGAIGASFTATLAGNYSCLLTNDCGSILSNVISLTETAIPSTPFVFSGQSLVCKNSSGILYDVVPAGGVTSYTWSVPAGSSIASGNGTNAINVDVGSNAVDGLVCVYASNGCGNSASICIPITVITAQPVKPSSIAGSIFPCAGSTGVVYACPAVANTSSYSWTVPAGVTIVSGQGTNTIAVNFPSVFTSGNIKVAAGNCIGTSAFRILSVKGKPSTPAAILGTLVGNCAGTSNVSFSVAPVAGASAYNWILPPNASFAGGQGTNAVLLDFNASFISGTLSVSASNTCGLSNSLTKTIRSVPARPGSITGNTNVCMNQSGLTYSIGLVDGASAYQWVVPAGASIVSGQNSNAIVVNFGNSGGKVKVRAVNACGNSTYQTVTVDIVCREESKSDESVFEVSIFPNPSTTYFTLKLNRTEEGSVILVLRDLAGREIERREGLNANGTLQFGEKLIGGMYIADLIIGTNRRSIQLMKQD